MILANYIRTSKSGSGEESLAGQAERSSAWAGAEGHGILGPFPDESLTGTTMAQRPALLAALQAIEDGEASGLLVPALDRLARALDVQEAILARVWNCGGRIYEAGRGEVLQDDPDDPMRKAMRKMAGVFFELDRDMAVLRTRRGRERKAAHGGYVGGFVRYGYRVVDRERVPDPSEQTVIAHMLALRGAAPPFRAYHKIATLLEVGGFPAPNQRGVWHATTVRNIIERERDVQCERVTTSS